MAHYLARAIELDDRFVKAYFRRASANLAIMKPKAAIVDLKKVLSLDKNNIPAKQQLDSTQKLLRRLLFEAAISGKDEIAVSAKILDQLQSGSAPIERDYTGPVVPADGLPTVEFVEEVIAWFKDGKVSFSSRSPCFIDLILLPFSSVDTKKNCVANCAGCAWHTERGTHLGRD
jgi:hypothetical protein